MVARLSGTRRGRAPRPGLAAGASRPVVIADTQDNPGAGGDANTTGTLRALVEADAQNAALGLFYDPEVVGQAVAAGVGARPRLRLGGQPAWPATAPSKASSRSRRFRRAGCALTAP